MAAPNYFSKFPNLKYVSIGDGDEKKKHENENAIHQEDIDRLLKTQKNQSRWFKIVITLIGITLLVNLTVLFYFVKYI